ncbi:hypothetical protein ACJQWK_10265 [Exserohilum turcicum]|uniref:NAD(P)-binding domain-containing protein n=1 Tax=Exserohilum turcicum (strain 28A) TaxID=671987 RepID=R0K257_EXST2|nr:uncharacterized protein SETTUDRAFT_163232 [Exserohilum turcica Et28A]EOA87223.1 hypothetical protein SETTUDRAFT_163232 [Exserohilum turcica Et28A]
MTFPVLVFGPGGSVGNAAAIEAHKRGAKVYLAMRDTSKEANGIQEGGKEDGYVRVQADLSQPDTIKHAVEISKAEAAFVYTVHGMQDHMRSAFEALKAAGISYIVLLSTFRVREPPSSEANMQNTIGAIHAKAEMALQGTGVPYTAVRPAYFNTNVLWGLEGIKKGRVELIYPNARFDYLAPADIGAVCGALLAEPQLRLDAGQSIYLCGPDLMTQSEAHSTIARTLGREIQIVEIDEQTWFSRLQHMPRPLLEDLAHDLKENSGGRDLYGGIYEQAVRNVATYSGREATRLGAWVEANAGVFAS